MRKRNDTKYEIGIYSTTPEKAVKMRTRKCFPIIDEWQVSISEYYLVIDGHETKAIQDRNNSSCFYVMYAACIQVGSKITQKGTFVRFDVGHWRIIAKFRDNTCFGVCKIMLEPIK